MAIGLILIFVVFGLFVLYASLVSADNAEQGKGLQVTTKNILEQVENLYNEKEYAILEILSKKYLERVPKHFGVRCYLAKCYFDTNKTTAAIYECLKILKKHREMDDIRLILAQAYRQKNLTIEALKQFEILYKRGDTSIEVIRNMAELFNKVSQYGASIKLYNMLIQKVEGDDEEISEIRQTLSQLNEKIGDYAAAFESYKARLQLSPNDYDSRKKMVLLYQKIGNSMKVISSLEELLDLPIPQEMRLWGLELMVKTTRECGEQMKALTHTEKLIDCPGANVLDAKCILADIYCSLDNLESAEKVLSDLSLEHEENIEVLTRLATVYEKQDRYSEANDIYNGLLVIIPSTEIRRVHNLMSNLYARWGASMLNGSELSDVTDSFKLFSMAIQFDSTNPYVHEQLAKANMMIKNYKEAISQLKIAMDYSEESEYKRYYLPLADCYHNINNAFEEKKALSNLIKIQPDNAEGHWKLAQLCESQHDTKGAKAMLEKTIELDPNMVEPKYRLALIYESDGFKNGAINLYRQILKLDPESKEVQSNLKTLLNFNYDSTEQTN